MTNVDTTSNSAAQNETSIDINPTNSSIRVLGDKAVARATGQTLTLEEAVAYALNETRP